MPVYYLIQTIIAKKSRAGERRKLRTQNSELGTQNSKFKTQNSRLKKARTEQCTTEHYRLQTTDYRPRNRIESEERRGCHCHCHRHPTTRNGYTDVLLFTYRIAFLYISFTITFTITLTLTFTQCIWIVRTGRMGRSVLFVRMCLFIWLSLST